MSTPMGEAKPSSSPISAGEASVTERSGSRLVDLLDRIQEGKEVFFHYIRTVGDLMTTDFTTLTLDHKVADYLAVLRDSRIQHIPVVEVTREHTGKPGRRKLIGIVSQRDLLRRISRGIGTPIQTDSDKAALEQGVDALVTRNPRTTMPDTSLFEAIQVMAEEKFGCLPVVLGPENDLVGVLTSIDIIRCFLRMETLRKARQAKPHPARLIDLVRCEGAGQPVELLVDVLMGTAADIMQVPVVFIGPDDPIEKAIHLMRERNFRHLPVVDGQGRVRGILSDRDVLRYLPPPAVGAQAAKRQSDPAQGALQHDLFRIDLRDEATVKTLSEKVTKAMTPTPVTANPTTSLSDVARLFCDQRIGSVPVVVANEPGVKGIITDTDMLFAFLALARLALQGKGVTFPEVKPS